MNMSNKAALALTVIIALSGCSSFDNPTRVNAGFKGSLYNSVSNSFDERMTTATIYGDVKGNDIGMAEVRVDSYSGGLGKPLYPTPAKAQLHINAINKYLKWDTLASQRKEMVTKDIVRIDDGYMSSTKHYYGIHSGNVGDNYLTAEIATADFSRGYHLIYFNRNNAVKYKAFLIRLRDGEMSLSNNGVYN